MARKAEETAERRAQLWIGGKRVPPSTGKYFVDRNPEDDSTYAQVAEAGVADVDRAVQAAQASFQEYRQTLAADREAWLSRAAAIVERLRGESGMPVEMRLIAIHILSGLSW